MLPSSAVTSPAIFRQSSGNLPAVFASQKAQRCPARPTCESALQGRTWIGARKTTLFWHYQQTNGRLREDNEDYFKPLLEEKTRRRCRDPARNDEEKALGEARRKLLNSMALAPDTPGRLDTVGRLGRRTGAMMTARED